MRDAAIRGSNRAMAGEDYLVWIDLEMTGLDIETERIIEAAAIITDAQLNVVAEGPEVVIHQPEPILAAMDAWNTEHHAKSGLTERVRRSTIDEAEAEQRLLSFVEAHCVAHTAPLAGNSIHQDRRFLQRFMPRLAGFLHYRNVDVSTVKELVRRWNPSAFESRPAKRGTHRALDDIRESIAELQHYRETAFRHEP